MTGRQFRGAAVIGIVLLSAIAAVAAYNVGFSRRGPAVGLSGAAGAGRIPPAFDEWHRQAHERLKEEKPADDSGRRG
jgi:hypothetical protein